jgi:hypothetical protein
MTKKLLIFIGDYKLTYRKRKLRFKLQERLKEPKSEIKSDTKEKLTSKIKLDEN